MKKKNIDNKKLTSKASKNRHKIKNHEEKTHDDSSKIVTINSQYSSQNFINVKKIQRIFITIIIIFILLIVRIGFLQFVQGGELKELAYSQQAINQIISPKRGNIYDRTGQVLATSAQVDTVTINPKSIKDKDDDEQKTKELKEKVAKGLSDIFGLNYDDVLAKVNSNSQVETIAKKVEQDKIDTLKAWMEENNVSVGINIDEDTKRYYPYNNLLSHVLGFCGDDNDGKYGIEYSWDSTLTGTPGKIVSAKDGSQQEIPNAEQSYIAPENGSDLTLTVDFNVQSIVEKYLKQACIYNECANGGSCIVMDPQTGDILAMANYPDYNLNDPDYVSSEVSSNYNSLSDEEKSNVLFSMWRNKTISDLYEPGSVFKVITASVAIEEQITGPDVPGDFNCVGYELFQDSSSSKPLKIDCWRYYKPHGEQSLRQALMNSCNPAFMQLAARIGASTLYKYYHAFGLFDKTGIDLSGEANSIFTPLEDVGPVELATAAFGQRTLNITPLQMITAISAVANEGVLMKPRIVKQVTNTDTGAVTNIEPEEVRQVLSKESADTVKSMMESVVVKGTGGNAKVSGYSIGGKTGTSEPIAGDIDQTYIASYVAIAPIEDTQVVLLLVLDGPQNEENGHQGGQVAGPVVSQMLTEILPYLNVPSDDVTSSNTDLITVPDIRDKTITEAEKILKDAGFTTKITTNNDKNSTTVIDQVPKPGTALIKNSIIMLYDADNAVRTSVTVPDLTGMSASQATSTLKALNLNISLNGTGTIISQNTPKDAKVEEGTVITVNLKSSSGDNH